MTALRTKRGGTPEYRIRIEPAVDERTQRPNTLLILQTTRTFASFRYTLSVEERIEGHDIHLRITGLEAPSLELPSSGPAEFRKTYEQLEGDYRFIIHGLDGSQSAFTARITAQTVAVTIPVTGGKLDVVLPSATN